MYRTWNPRILEKRKITRRAVIRPETRLESLMSSPAAPNLEVSKKIFSALPEKGIRLIIIHPGSYSDHIRCDIRLATLADSPPPYYALSHVWGSDHNPEQIRLNGENFDIRKNLAKTLRQLRRGDKAVVFWIDALCINQCDEDEKRVQIPLIGDIYKEAEKVVAFLGDHDASSRLLFKVLQGLERQVNIGYILMRLGSEDLASIKDATYTFLAREYWSRAWIVQELILGRDRRIQCSTDEVSFSALQTLLDGLAGWPVVMKLSPGGPDRYAALSPSTRWHPRFQQLLKTGSTLSTNGFLDGFLDSRCSYPQDHIYAFYNLFPEEIKSYIEVNVKKEPEEIICQAAQGIIKETRSLHIITLRGRQMRPVDLWQYNLPSWCPFFGVEFLNDPILPEFSGDPIYLSNDEPIAKFSKDGKRLEVKGVMIGQICTTVFRNPLASRPFEDIDFKDEELIPSGNMPANAFTSSYHDLSTMLNCLRLF
ncbi:heterokaryon incompatibility protein-domain-containing protein [Aspergillus caelatus]|uniref:Heterokaryon incompatibility protein-domain-containing protein n=1 Tax=Aspergillus caelatus TaxID=61420 RepID=A0A5N7A6Y7_9EURO|nr:heterokaryon incompatibility protein-domain-containing protein [Aspergillus caelatus]KAE8365198.1 heterokaryon incompatibility protein-domain-containing protein [Aspergillus caelatus]